MLWNDLENYRSISLTSCLTSELMVVFENNQRNMLNNKKKINLDSVTEVIALGLDKETTTLT